MSQPEMMHTEKIPDFILLKESRKEVGQLKSEIDHLEHELKIMQKQAKVLEDKSLNYQLQNNEWKKGVKSELMYQKLREQNKKLTNRVKSLRDAIKELITPKS